MDYSVIYSNRKTISLSVKGGVVTVRAPRRTPKSFIDDFVRRHSAFIEKHLPEEKSRMEKYCSLTESEIEKIKKEARAYFSEKTEYYSRIMGLKFSRITITGAKTRFGSCSSKGNISFSYRLMLYPEAAREYVVVHELAHLCEMNHSKNFYAVIEKILPDYKERIKLLK